MKIDRLIPNKLSTQAEILYSRYDRHGMGSGQDTEYQNARSRPLLGEGQDRFSTFN